jgi:hypothetical protein
MDIISAEPVTVSVPTSGDLGFQSIGAALAAAPDGATIVVQPAGYDRRGAGPRQRGRAGWQRGDSAPDGHGRHDGKRFGNAAPSRLAWR